MMRVLIPVVLLLASCGASGEVDPAPEHQAAAPGAAPAVAAITPAAPEPAIAEAPSPPAPEPVSLQHLTGDVDPATDPLFKRIPERHLGGSRVWGHAEAVDALAAMADAAAADGVTLKAVSAFRSFRDQKRIWEGKWTGATLVDGGRLPDTVPDPAARARKILEFSSMPGTSRHHWGTDFDLNSLDNSWFASGEGKRVHDWLTAHAAEFGFCQVYSPKGADRPSGYEEEKWHWSYLPVARRYLAQYPDVVGYDRIAGFAGSEAAAAIDVISAYVEGINPSCR